MSEPEQEKKRTDEPNLHPGQYDEGGTGGMATREVQARHQHDGGPQEPAPQDPTPPDVAPTETAPQDTRED